MSLYVTCVVRKDLCKTGRSEKRYCGRLSNIKEGQKIIFLPGYSVGIDLTDIPFPYEEFEETRKTLIEDVCRLMTDADKHFLLSFESGNPDWEGYEFEYFKDYPSVKWKLLNLKKLAKQNPRKLEEEVKKLKDVFHI